jgi:ABC-2 type transport system ATP-binding protein
MPEACENRNETGKMLSVQRLRKSFGGRIAVDGLNFSISSEEIYGLLGPNGAGKSTSILMIAGILERDAGNVFINGLDADRSPSVRAFVGIVPQAIALYLGLTARENLDFWGGMYYLRGDLLCEAREYALHAVGLTQRADDIVNTYSGGMRRRLNLACGIVHGPKLLIVDEPMVGVDPQSRSAIISLLERLRDSGTAILYTTHQIEEAERLCTRIGILDSGRLIVEGTSEGLIASLGSKARIEVGFRHDDMLERAACVVRAGIESASVRNRHLHIVTDHAAERLPTLLTRLLEAEIITDSARVVEPNLEDVFLRMTGRALRD